MTGEDRRDVMLAFPHNGTVTTGFALSVLAAVHAPGSRIGGVTDLRTGPFLAHARGEIAKRFLATDGMDWLWMIDTDMVFSADTLPALLDWADPEQMPLIGAACRTLAGDGQVIITAYRAGKEETGEYGLTSLSGTGLPGDTLIQVDATGCACLLAHRSVFTRIDQNNPAGPGLWFAEKIIDGRIFGEDMSFCLAAADAGIPVHVHTGVQAGHLRPMQLGEVCP